MAQPRIKITSDGTRGGYQSANTKIEYLNGDECVDLSGVIGKVEWAIDAVGDGRARAVLHIAFPMLEAAAENVKAVINQFLPSIIEYPLECECGWAGSVGEATPDIDGDGGLGCPDCGRLLDSDIPC